MHNIIKVSVDTTEIDIAQKKIDRLINSIEKLNELTEKQNKKPANNDKLDVEMILQKIEQNMLKEPSSSDIF